MFCVEPFGSMLEAAVVPREWQHVTFVEAQPAYPIPPTAPWWTRPSVDAALESDNSVLKRVSWRVLSRDSTLPLKELRRLTEGAAAGVGPAIGLLANPRVTASVELLTILGRGPHPSGLAQELLFQLHGDALASDPRADTAALAMVIERLHGGDHPDIAQPLARNPVVRDDERLLRRLIQQAGGDSVTCHAALAIYASRWPLGRELPSIDPGRASLQHDVPPTQRVRHGGRHHVGRAGDGGSGPPGPSTPRSQTLQRGVADHAESRHPAPVPRRTDVRDHRQFRREDVPGERHGPSEHPARAVLLSGRHGAMGGPSLRQHGAILSDPDAGRVLRHHGRRSGAQRAGPLARYDRSGRSVSEPLRSPSSRSGLHLECLRLVARRTPRRTGGTGRLSGRREGASTPIMSAAALPKPQGPSFALTRHAGTHESQGDARLVAR